MSSEQPPQRYALFDEGSQTQNRAPFSTRRGPTGAQGGRKGCPWRALVVALVSILLTQTALAQEVKTDFDRSADFTTFRRYAWKVHPLLEKDPELLNSIGAELVRMGVNEKLIDRGFEPTEVEFADFFVTFFGGRRKEQEVVGATSFSTGGGYGWGAPQWQTGWTEVMVRNYVEGTLVLDFVNAKTNELAWRAYCKGAVRNPNKRDKVIYKAIEKALKQFPPKPD